MSTTLTYTGQLVIATCWCGIRHAMPVELYDEAHRNGKATYCPLGHSGTWGETEGARLRRELRWAEDTAASERARADQAEASLRTTKGHVTRLRRRAIAGVCAFCHRRFANVERHVASKHGDEQP